jgi:uncharacterized protein YlxW (UPF0749 family)
VNWWEDSQYDLKSIRSSGWNSSLIADTTILTIRRREEDALNGWRRLKISSVVLRQKRHLTKVMRKREEESVRDEKALAAVNKKIRDQKKKVQVLESEQIELITKIRDEIKSDQAKELILGQMYSRLF